MKQSGGLASAFGMFRARHARPLSRDKADTLLLLFACALVLLPHAGHLPAWVPPVCAAILGWRAWITFRGNRMPPRWLLLPAACSAMAGIYLSFNTLFGREAGVAMLALLLTFKLLEMHAKRDLFVVLFLCFFLILSSFFYSQSIGTALLTIVAVIAILTTQLSFQYTGAVPPLRKRLRLGAGILALAAPLTLVLFFLFPRIQGPLWGMPGDAQSGRTGMSESMAPGNIARLARSEDVAFRAKFLGTPPPKSQLYWRGIVLGNYDGRTWTALSTRLRAGRNIEVKRRDDPVRYQVTLEPHGRRWLFALDMPQAVPIIGDTPASVTYDVQLLAPAPVHDRIRYDAASHVDYDLQPNETPLLLRHWLDLPPGFNPRTHEFADRFRRMSQDSLTLVNAVLRHFREQEFRYTLEPPALGKHSVDEFLFDTRAGFCEHYAGAFVILMRTLDIPARVVTGYQGGELNPADGFMTVRQSDAHAWAEVWLPNRGWVRVDPTAAVAPNRVEQNLSSVIPRTVLGGLFTLDQNSSGLVGSLMKLRQQWDAATNAWNQWVLNYTPQKQRDFIKSFGFDNVDWRTMVLLMLGFGVAAVAIAVLPLLLRQQRRDPLDKVYDAFCVLMAKRGLPRAAHEGPRAYRQRLVADATVVNEKQAAALARFLELYETVRYGAEPPAKAVPTLKSLLAECR